jgi:aspartate/methionine/tyrosine aminotransferase
VSAGVADRLTPFGTTIFAQMSALAKEHGAINLSQGFPDFDGPEHVKEAAVGAVRAGHNQYARMFGEPVLNAAIAGWFAGASGIEADPDREITVTAGCTEAIAATLLGLVNPGDEVILFEPYYDSYRACVAMAGATPRFVALRAPGWLFDERELRAAFTARTRAILVNTPHNPTGKVFTREELGLIASLCAEHGVIAVADEVYERLVFEGEHVCIASLDGMRGRTVTLSSLGKTFGLTGWKIGWAIAPPDLTAGVRSAHQFLTFAVSTPMQHAAAAALGSPAGYFEGFVRDYRARRDLLCSALLEIGFALTPPAGTYFVMADHSAFGVGDDVAFCKHLAVEIGVAAIPPSAFYMNTALGRPLVRFAFCKTMATLEAAIERLRRLG